MRQLATQQKLVEVPNNAWHNHAILFICESCTDWSLSGNYAFQVSTVPPDRLEHNKPSSLQQSRSALQQKNLMSSSDSIGLGNVANALRPSQPHTTIATHNNSFLSTSDEEDSAQEKSCFKTKIRCKNGQRVSKSFDRRYTCTEGSGLKRGTRKKP